ncbi:class I SAM-dependent methyltransferase [Christiangramia salexigens]|uniref:SAM-dependent methyltransferase n=1 Tax=Christiangramia salexigens TaxID=1913577 RepID=A0A1L3J313_9FLAO|nr:class I SAM-dependent methyltransferase [Christiangramia salexigens]APG59517.1 SAM-dependent methyltransferase [Christiangramia salexigens]
MLNRALLQKEVSDYIQKNYKKDLPSIILKGSPFQEIGTAELGVQMNGLKVAEKKFPELFKTSGILYPPKLNLEQSSSQVTAEYKASLVEGDFGIDLTGGIGIDSYYMSKKFQNYIYCEINQELAELARHNFKMLNANNISVHAGDGLEIIKNDTTQYSWIYLDPARRDNSGGKVFKLKDCEPDVPRNLEYLFRISNNILIKTSPILDISAGLDELNFVKEIHIIAVRNEVKELLWILEKGYDGPTNIKSLNIEKDIRQEFFANFEKVKNSYNYSEPEHYLYEPNAAIMKSGLFQSLAEELNLNKLHEHSHLFTSKEKIEFPGRVFKIVDYKTYKTQDLKKHFKGSKANIAIRNFPDPVNDIRKKLKIKDGGKLYLFFTTNLRNEKIVIICEKN